MDNTPIEETSQSGPPETTLFVSFSWLGKDNGLSKSGFDSRVVTLPSGVNLVSAADIQSLADAIATSEFNGEKRFSGLEITILAFTKLPLGNG